MTKSDITKSKIYPVLVLESYVSEKTVHGLTKFLETLFLGFVVIAMGSSLVVQRLDIPNANELAKYFELKFLGILIINFILIILVFLVRSYLHSSYYFENVINNRYQSKDLYTFTVGRILYNTPNNDWLRGLLISEVGREIASRCGLADEQIANFLKDRPVAPSNLALSTENILKLRDFVSLLYKENPDFGRLLYVVGIGETDLLNIVDWVVEGIEDREIRQRFWRRENLERLGSIGKSWSYGITPRLDLYSEDLLDRQESLFSAYEVSFRDQEVAQLESVLSRSSESNVLLIGETESVRMDVLWDFVRKIKQGTVLSNLEHKRILLFNTGTFLAGFKERSDFEKELVRVFKEAVGAGDVVLVFNDFSAFLAGAESLHSQVFSLLDQYFASSRLQIIAMSDTDKFHHSLETRSEVMSRFEKVIVRDLTPEETVMTLLEGVDKVERETGMHFSYPALKQIVTSADAYLQEGSLTEKAKDLVVEIVPWALKTGKKLIVPADISAYLQEKTNIPMGAITDQEKEILINLEDILHQRIVGQEQAVSAIASAMKRARAGVQNQKRPLGSFLFLGPTGVGKTETAKALAVAYFGGEEKLMRLDMTEYQDEDSLGKLIGSFKDDKPGILANMIRQNMFGVLLLDEFEKTNKEVQNLFLQILDEGVFSDMNGKRVNARNVIFIATSNAGSGTIWNMVKEGKDPVGQKDAIINEIVNTGVFKPELLNRYDEVIIFHPLSPDNLFKIAGFMLKKLAKRLEQKGINLVVNDFLSAKVSREGSNEIFGARPMNRYIQDKIEQAVADKIITGELKPGSKVEFQESLDSSSPFSITIS